MYPKGMALLALLFLLSCAKQEQETPPSTADWTRRTLTTPLAGELERGTTYLSVYSQIYSRREDRIHDLTATISLRNTSRRDSVFLQAAEYFDTHGERIRTYTGQTVILMPLETVEIVIREADRAGGTGGNFLFDWLIRPGANPPLAEGVMISTSGQQGLSFTTIGVRVR